MEGGEGKGQAITTDRKDKTNKQLGAWTAGKGERERRRERKKEVYSKGIVVVMCSMVVAL